MLCGVLLYCVCIANMSVSVVNVIMLSVDMLSLYSSAEFHLLSVYY